MAPARFPDKQLILNTWEPRVGRRAALGVWWTKLLLAQAIYIATFDFVAVFIGIQVFHSNYAGAAAWILGAASMTYFMTSFIGLWVFRRAGSKTLGVIITGKNTPPSLVGPYLDWCAKNGVQPYQHERS